MSLNERLGTPPSPDRDPEAEAAIASVLEPPPPELPAPVPGEAGDVSAVVALARARRDMGTLAKSDQYNQGGTRYSYRGVDRVVNATRPVLERHGILLVPYVSSYEQRDIPRQTGGRSGMSIVHMEYWVYGPQGDHLPMPVRVIGEAMDTSDKDAAKAQSVAWRVALIQLLHIATGDPDPDSMRIDRGEAPTFNPLDYREEALNPATSVGRLSQMIHDLKTHGKGDVLVENEVGDEEKIGNLVWRVRRERSSGGPAA